LVLTAVLTDVTQELDDPPGGTMFEGDAVTSACSAGSAVGTVDRLAVSRNRSVDLCADDGISDARRVADPHGVNLARWCTLCGRVLYARVTALR
jgi:hypothetical protein